MPVRIIYSVSVVTAAPPESVSGILILFLTKLISFDNGLPGRIIYSAAVVTATVLVSSSGIFILFLTKLISSDNLLPVLIIYSVSVVRALPIESVTGIFTRLSFVFIIQLSVVIRLLPILTLSPSEKTPQ